MPRGKRARPVAAEIIPSAGRWHGFVQTGIDANGDPIRTHRSVTFCVDCKAEPSQDCKAKCYKRCEAKVRQVEEALSAGRPIDKQDRNPGAVQCLTAYLDLCQERVDAGTMAYHTARSYRLQLDRVIPHVHNLRIRGLDRDTIRAILREVQRTVSADAARKVLTVLRIALTWARREGYVDRNEAELVDMPTIGKAKAKIEPLSEEEFAAVIPVIWRREQRRARWLLALIHGPRQSECLGLALRRPDQPRVPSDVNMRRGTLTYREKTERRFWEHGCADPYACGATPRPHPERPGIMLPPLHRTKPCPPRWKHGCGDPQACTKNRTDRCPKRRPLAGCRDHPGKHGCPPPCAPNCTGHAASCPDRKGGGLVSAYTKTEATKHTIVLDPLVAKAFELDLADREAWKERAGSKWVDSGMVFVTRFGRRVDPHDDWEEWQDILTEAGLPRTRIHDLRHTAVTNMFAAGLGKHAVQQMIGWSQDMSGVYAHVVEAVTRGQTAQYGAWLRGSGVLVEPAPIRTDSATGLLPDDLGNVIPFRRKVV